MHFTIVGYVPLLCTSNGKLYIGTYDGLGCLDISTMSFTSTYKKNRIFGGSIVLTLFEDEQGDIWAGTTKGLIHIDGKNGNSKTYTTHDGLPNNTICAIQSDRQHGLWISTNYGITNINLETAILPTTMQEMDYKETNSVKMLPARAKRIILFLEESMASLISVRQKSLQK